MRVQRRGQRRRAATLVESALGTLMFLFVVFAVFEVALWARAHVTVSHAARRGARLCVVRGSLAKDTVGAWGPDTLDSSDPGADASFVSAMRSAQIGLDPDDTTAVAEWLDGKNEPGNRVRVKVTSSYRPIFTHIIGGEPLPLSASSTQRIAN